MVSQGSILGPLFFLLYINDLSENTESTVKFFADDASLFSVLHDDSTSAEVLNRVCGTYLNEYKNGKCHSILM